MMALNTIESGLVHLKRREKETKETFPTTITVIFGIGLIPSFLQASEAHNTER